MKKKNKNTNKKQSKMSLWKKILIVLLSIIVVFAIIIFIYINDYYKADQEMINAFSPYSEVEKTEISKDIIYYGHKNNENAFIFYPGGKVEHLAYEPLLKNIASQGITTILVKMPGNLAVLDVNAANEIRELFPNVKNWYIGGHSLGGASAVIHVENNINEYKGLILLGAYASNDISNANLKVLSIVGTNDKVVDMEAYNNGLSLLPKDAVEIKIDGGNHAYYGMYGEQEGDGKATISNIDQINTTTDSIVYFILN